MAFVISPPNAPDLIVEAAARGITGKNGNLVLVLVERNSEGPTA